MWSLLQHSMCILTVFTRQSSYCFQCVLAITVLSVRLSHGWISQTVQDRITKSSPLAARKTLVKVGFGSWNLNIVCRVLFSYLGVLIALWPTHAKPHTQHTSNHVTSFSKILWWKKWINKKTSVVKHKPTVNCCSGWTNNNNICKKLTSLQLCVRTMWWYQSSKTAKIIWVTLDGAMHMASLQADFSW